MKFILHEIKLWFSNDHSETKSYEFLANKVNVVTGDATTGKTSFWSIIDYCLLSDKINIANTINEKVLWYGLRFSINNKEASIIRKTPSKGAVSSEVYFDYGSFPTKPFNNKSIHEIRSILDEEFGITDALRFPHGKEMGKTSFNISFRYFLLFSSLTETIIGAPKTYFDTTFYGKDEYENALKHIFDIVIGVNDMEKIKALERLEEINKELLKIQRQNVKNHNNSKKFISAILQLVDKCKKYNFIEYSENFDEENFDEAITTIKDVISQTRKRAENQKLFSELDNMYKKKRELKSQIDAINKYQKEYRLYQRNLNKSADSLEPIKLLKTQLSDQLINTYESKLFIDSLASSLKSIKNHINKKSYNPVPVNGDLKELNREFKQINNQINKLDEIRKDDLREGEKFIVLGEIKNALENIEKSKKNIPIDKDYLNGLDEEKRHLEKIPDAIKQTKYIMKNLLDESIQRNYNKLSSLPTYKDHLTRFNENEMILKLYPPSEMFPLDNVGSKSNYMFMHLCFYLGLHEHIIKTEQPHVPQFLFIDQPSIPYYTGDDEKGNDDKSKLIDAFRLLNSFIEYIITEQKNSFQIFMVEHAPKDYWEDNNLSYFHLVDEFTEGKGLIPKHIYNS